MRSSRAAVSLGVEIEVEVMVRRLGSIESAGSWRKVIRWRILRFLKDKRLVRGEASSWRQSDSFTAE